MPELPEVETTLSGVKPYLKSQVIQSVVIRQQRLRWPIANDLPQKLQGLSFQCFHRRAKYLVFEFSTGSLIIHLGMSGRLTVLPHEVEAKKHDHVDIILKNGAILRYTDPRRFGAVLWCEGDWRDFSLFKSLGVEPLSDAFKVSYLKQCLKKRTQTIKQVIMDHKVVVGVGNIYASESLFLAGIDPRKPANKISQQRLQRLVDAIKIVLKNAILAGGTTLKDFYGVDGAKGYFSQELNVYGRHGQACRQCGKEIKSLTLGQRNTFYCNRCQK